MAQYIDKSALIAKIKKRFDEYSSSILRHYDACTEARASELGKILVILNTLEVKEDGDNYLEKFKSLQHIDKDSHRTLKNWGYAPNLYYFDGSWHVDWISCEEGDSINADMCYYNDGTAIKIDANSYLVRKKLWQDIEVIPCWSLAALLDVLLEIKGGKPMIVLDDNWITYPHVNDLHTKPDNLNLIDACVEMIIKLHEQNML